MRLGIRLANPQQDEETDAGGDSIQVAAIALQDAVMEYNKKFNKQLMERNVLLLLRMLVKLVNSLGSLQMSFQKILIGLFTEWRNNNLATLPR